MTTKKTETIKPKVAAKKPKTTEPVKVKEELATVPETTIKASVGDTPDTATVEITADKDACYIPDLATQLAKFPEFAPPKRKNVIILKYGMSLELEDYDDAQRDRLLHAIINNSTSKLTINLANGDTLYVCNSQIVGLIEA